MRQRFFMKLRESSACLPPRYLELSTSQHVSGAVLSENRNDAAQSQGERA